MRKVVILVHVPNMATLSVTIAFINQYILDLRAKVKSLEDENSHFRELFSVDKLKNDDSALRFYAGFPNE